MRIDIVQDQNYSFDLLNQFVIDRISLYMATENLFLRPASPLHEAFNLANNVLAEDYRSFTRIFNNEPKITTFFADLRGEVKKNHKATRRFDETLNLLKNSAVYQEFDESSFTFFGDIQPQVRHVLYLLSWGFNNCYNNNDDKTLILKVMIENKKQLSSLSTKLRKKPEKISITELTDAIMNGNFDPSFLKKATPLKNL